jgi:hypothetical protein
VFVFEPTDGEPGEGRAHQLVSDFADIRAQPLVRSARAPSVRQTTGPGSSSSPIVSGHP